MVTIYSRPTCSPCQTLKLYLFRKGIDFEVKDADEHREELLKFSNASIVPITVFDNDPSKVVEGMNLQRIASFL